MKKILIALFVLIGFVAKSQQLVPRAASSVQVQDARIQAKYNLIIPVYPDTTTANTFKGLDSLGAIIQIRTTGVQYKRDTSAGGGHKWTAIGGGTSGIDDVLALRQRLTTSRTIDGNAHDLTIDSAHNIFLHGVVAAGDTRVSLEDTSTSIYASGSSHVSVIAVTPRKIEFQPDGFGSALAGYVWTLIDPSDGSGHWAAGGGGGGGTDSGIYVNNTIIKTITGTSIGLAVDTTVIASKYYVDHLTDSFTLRTPGTGTGAIPYAFTNAGALVIPKHNFLPPLLVTVQSDSLITHSVDTSTSLTGLATKAYVLNNAGSGGGGAISNVTFVVGTTNYTMTTDGYFDLADLSAQANRTLTLPAATSKKYYVIKNNNPPTSSFTWTFSGRTVRDFSNNTVTTVPNYTVIQMVDDGTNLNIIN